MYIDAGGQRIADAATLRRIRGLAIPPAYTDVRIAADPRAHIQAIGRDDAGRIQYRYHPDWETVREARKLGRLARVCEVMPRLRRTVARDLNRPGLERRRIIAAVVTVIDRTHVRIGHDDYVHTGRSRGAATLLKRNATLDGDFVRLDFRGKGRRQVHVEVVSRPLARVLADLLCLRGSRLFRYRDEAGRLRNVTALDVNAYLNEIARAPVTAKDFRTLSATAAAAARLSQMEPEQSPTRRRRQLAGVMREVADMLGNTPAVVRRSYVHRRVVDAFEKGRLQRLARALGGERSPAIGQALVGELFCGTGPGKSAAATDRVPDRQS